MIIGHVGVALTARWRWPKAPLGWLLAASFAPDITRALIAAAAMPWRVTNVYSHALPWSGVLVVALTLLAWIAWRDVPTALVIGGLVASHIALDLISGRKALWAGGPTGLNLGEIEQVEFMLEAAMAWIGWRLLRGTTAPRWMVSRPLLILLLAVQAQYLIVSYRSRPWLTRCIVYPFAACPDR